MAALSWDARLELFTQQLDTLATAMLCGDVRVIEALAPELQEIAVGLLQTAHGIQRNGVQSAQRVARLRLVGLKLQALREGMIRQSAYVDRALQVVLPAAALTTYQDRALYGSGVRQSGAFQGYAA